jgi:putative peptidoglycan lipid II flippase
METSVNKNIRQASILLLVCMMVSRVIGFFREWALAHFVGATGDTDVYLASFTVPDFMNYLMAAGALSISFIPVLSPYVARKRKSEAERTYRYVMTRMSIFFLILLTLGEIFASQLAVLVAPGFTDEQIELLTSLIRIIMPAQFFFYWGGLANALQQTHGKFIYTALGGILYNCGIISIGILLHARLGIVAFSLGVLFGAMMSHGFLQWWGLRKLGYSSVPYFSQDEKAKADLKKYLLLSLPIMVGFSLAITDEWIVKYFGSSLETRSVSYLGYARNIMRVPVAILGQVAGIASFPFLSKLWAEGDLEEYSNVLTRELMKVFALAPLAAIFFFTHSLSITDFIYHGGKFTSEDLLVTSMCLKFLGIGVPFWITHVILSRAFYATQRTWIPSLVGGVLSVFAILLYREMAQEWGVYGLAGASSVGMGLYCLILGSWLFFFLRTHSDKISLRPFFVFAAAWSGVLLICAVFSFWATHLGIYTGTRISALLDCAVGALVPGIFALVLLRTVFRKLTFDEPLF